MVVYLFCLALATQAFAYYAYRAWQFRFYPGFRVFAVLQVALVFWILCYLAEQTDHSGRHWWFLLKFAGIGLVAPSWFLFILAYTKIWPRSFGWWLLIYFWAAALPVITLTNDYHHWFFREIVVQNELIGLNGPIFGWHVLWNYLLLAASLVLLATFWWRVPAKRGSTGMLLLAGLLPWLASIANELTKAPATGVPLLPVNPTLPAFVLSTLAFAWAIFKKGLLDPRPLARDRLFNVLQDGLLVLDSDRRVVDRNEAARRLLETTGQPLLGQRLEDNRGPLRSLARISQTDREFDEPLEIEFVREGQPLLCDVRLLPLKAADLHVAGWLLTIRDIGSRKNLLRMAEKGLSPREQELVEWVNQGLSNKEIAVLLDIGTATVKNHLYNIFKKCQVGSRQELLRILRSRN